MVVWTERGVTVRYAGAVAGALDEAGKLGESCRRFLDVMRRALASGDVERARIAAGCAVMAARSAGRVALGVRS